MTTTSNNDYYTKTISLRYGVWDKDTKNVKQKSEVVKETAPTQKLNPGTETKRQGGFLASPGLCH